LECN